MRFWRNESVRSIWRQYRELNLHELAKRVRKPAWVFDVRAVTDPVHVRAAGLTYWRVGDGDGRH